MKSEIKRDKSGGFYTLYIDGVFEGNYDTYTEAAQAYEKIVWVRGCYEGFSKCVSTNISTNLSYLR